MAEFATTSYSVCARGSRHRASITDDDSRARASLAPVQLTPERTQTIGVKLAKAEMENVIDDIRATGNVEINERQVAYVQTRFPGWIRQVYANASYQFVRKGQPLFTFADRQQALSWAAGKIPNSKQ